MSTGTADFASYRFSTRELPERLRIPMWRERFCRGIVHADIEPSSDGPFQAEATALPGDSGPSPGHLSSLSAAPDDVIGNIVHEARE